MEPAISIVVPFYNEGPNVLPVAQAVLQALEGRGVMELILVDDGSTDDTWERIREARSRHACIRGVRHSRNAGQSAALWSGFKASRGSVIGTLDGDLQNDPADLPRMLTELQTCDMVCGMRTRRQDTFVRRLSSRVALWARKAALGMDFRDTGCNLRVFNRSVLPLLVPFNGIHRFMPILVAGGGARVKEVPVVHHPRRAGLSKYGIANRLGRGIYDLVAVRWLLKRQLREQNVTEAE
jgi:dolichol-phosphate mannosyltransferase